MLCTTMYLGIWQLQRMEWKNDIISKIEKNLQTTITYDDFNNIEEDEFKLMKIRGKFIHDKNFDLLSRTYNGKAGVHVLTPFIAENGELLLVNRGWVKAGSDYKEPTETVELEAVIRTTQKPGWLSLENDPEKNHWFSINLPAMYKILNKPAKIFYLDRVSGEKSFPLALPKKIQLHNEHLQYVITWFSLSFALVIMYYFRFWKNKD